MSRVHTDICARCGVDRATQRREGWPCFPLRTGKRYGAHVWGWDDPEHGQPGHFCGACASLPPAA